jgi:hypothetical protein
MSSNHDNTLIFARSGMPIEASLYCKMARALGWRVGLFAQGSTKVKKLTYTNDAKQKPKVK